MDSRLTVFVEAHPQPAALAQTINIVLELGDDAAERGDLGGKRAVDDRGQRRDDGGEGEQDHEDPFSGDGHWVVGVGGCGL